ncbi:MAG TPA: amidohydrolase family protein [Jatrophihabitantaceae bacterium]|jgi:predicted TIM-barrel fold metal-dependent hydrolase|nr:amidohydrolase family protein [Jatrophihabitantaceae bacterium]
MTKLCVISSDGHATAQMEEYRPYLDAEYRDEFDEFLVEWSQHGSHTFELPALQRRLDPDEAQRWAEEMVEPGRLEGNWNPARRLQEMAREGMTGEVLFPDFGIPFELMTGSLASAMNYVPEYDAKRTRAARNAFNRWLADFVGHAPLRWAGMAIVSWDDVESAVADIRAAKAAGLSGIVLPAFAPERPLFHPDFEPVWNVLGELDMVVNSHAVISSTSNQPVRTSGIPHPALNTRLFSQEAVFFCRNIMTHLIWGGVMERHPEIRFVFTEQGTGWVIGHLESMDYSYEGSYGRTDVRDVIRHKPSEYFARQCYMGSSLFSQNEVAVRHLVGIEHMMIGMDYPHHEGTVLGGTQNYLRATLGAEQVPVDEARLLLAETAGRVFGFDLPALAPIADELNVTSESILTPPEIDLFPRGDVHRPGWGSGSS